MSTKHTPGPWTVGGTNGNAVFGAEDEIGRLLVAHCNHTGEIPPQVDEANACLIAAAPDLLSALATLLYGAMESEQDVTPIADKLEAIYEPGTLAKARAAISRATGK